MRPCNCKEEGSPNHFSACEKYMKFSDRDPGALRYRLKDINRIVEWCSDENKGMEDLPLDKWEGLEEITFDMIWDEIKKLSEVDDE